MELTLVLKAIADETRKKILTLLLRHNYCARALARNLELSERGVSQHLKVLRDAGLLTGEKRGYYMHYNVNRNVLHTLADEIEALACVKRETCTPEAGNCKGLLKGENSHGHHGHRQCHKSE